MSRRGMLPAHVSPKQCECGDHYFAPTNRGLNVLVSPDDQSLLSKKWFAKSVRYPALVRTEVKDGRRVFVSLSRSIMRPEVGLEVDHINLDPLDNRRPNLRVCSHSDNAKNRRRVSRSTTGAKGVKREGGKFRADITVGYARHYLGTYDTVDAAYAAYCKAAAELHGEYARFE